MALQEEPTRTGSAAPALPDGRAGLTRAVRSASAPRTGLGVVIDHPDHLSGDACGARLQDLTGQQVAAAGGG